MTDRPILFSAPMVRALLDGHKTQTRRLASSKPMQRVQPGDRLWVRESAWIAPVGWTDSPVNPMGPHRQEVAFLADDRSGYTKAAAADYRLKLRPSILMPGWASRLTLTVTETRVEPLQWILETDARAEGIMPEQFHPAESPHFADGLGGTYSYASHAYASLWNSLHPAPAEQWDANPDVIALTFKVERRNFDG